MKRYVPLLLLMVLAAAALAACGPAATPLPPTATPVRSTATPLPPAATPAAPGPFPLTITDDLGRQVTLSAPARRVISLAPSNTEIIFAVGAGGQVVGVTEYCNYPPQAQSLEKIGGFSANTISVEKIVSLEPDLVLSVGDIQRPVIDALEQLNIQVVALDPHTLDDVYTRIELVGRLTGHEAEAAQVVTEMKERVAMVTQRVAAIPAGDRARVYWEVFDQPRMTAGPSTFIGQLIDLAGGVNIFADLDEDYPQISDEEVIARNPAVIMGADTMGEKLTTEMVGQRPGWARIGAVQDSRIYLFDGDMVTRAGPRLAQVLETMATALYPELFR